MPVAADSMGQSILQWVPYSNWNQAHVRYNVFDYLVTFLKPSITFSEIFQFILNIPVLLIYAFGYLEFQYTRNMYLNFYAYHHHIDHIQ